MLNLGCTVWSNTMTAAAAVAAAAVEITAGLYRVLTSMP